MTGHSLNPAAPVARSGDAAITPAAEHFHLISNNFSRVTISAGLFVLPFTRLQFAFDVNAAAFFQVLAGNLSQAAVHADIVPFSFFLLLARLLVFPASCRCN